MQTGLLQAELPWGRSWVLKVLKLNGSSSRLSDSPHTHGNTTEREVAAAKAQLLRNPL
jgi:hypothetical protein